MQSPSILPLLAFITGVYFAAGFSEHRDPRLVHVKRMGSCGGLSSGQFLVSVPCISLCSVVALALFHLLFLLFSSTSIGCSFPHSLGQHLWYPLFPWRDSSKHWNHFLEGSKAEITCRFPRNGSISCAAWQRCRRLVMMKVADFPALRAVVFCLWAMVALASLVAPAPC